MITVPIWLAVLSLIGAAFVGTLMAGVLFGACILSAEADANAERIYSMMEVGDER